MVPPFIVDPSSLWNHLELRRVDLKADAVLSDTFDQQLITAPRQLGADYQQIGCGWVREAFRLEVHRLTGVVADADDIARGSFVLRNPVTEHVVGAGRDALRARFRPALLFGEEVVLTRHRLDDGGPLDPDIDGAIPADGGADDRGRRGLRHPLHECAPGTDGVNRRDR